MDWIPAISTSALLGGALWLSRNLFITRLKNSVEHEYNQKIEELKTELRKNEETFKAEIRAGESQIQSLRSGALSEISTRQSSVFSRRLKAIDDLWGAVVDLRGARGVSDTMRMFKFEELSKEAAVNPRLRKMFETMSNIDMETLNQREAHESRPYVSEIAWAYYKAYHAIVSHAVFRLHLLKNGIDHTGIVDTKEVMKVAELALPHQKDLLAKFGASALHHLLDELEKKLLFSFNEIINGVSADKETLTRAAGIIKQSEELLKSSDIVKTQDA